MSVDKTYSRDYLQGFRDQCKQDLAGRIIARCVNTLLNAAANEKTSYWYEISATPDLYGFYSYISPTTLTTDDYISAFHRKFPNCSISYQETWEPTTLIMKKGILIDWS